jgi:hypothetical protein
LEAVGDPIALHRRADADGLRHRPVGAVSRLFLRLGAGERHDLRHGRSRHPCPAGRTGFVVHQAIHPSLRVAHLPAPHRRPADRGLACDRGNGRSRSADSKVAQARWTCFRARFRSAAIAVVVRDPQRRRWRKQPEVIRPAWQAPAPACIVRLRQCTSLTALAAMPGIRL